MITSPGMLGATVHACYAAQARCTPDAVAVVCGDERLTYAELERRADRVAHGLARRGVTRGSLVAVCTERSAELIVGLLAVLKAGAAYVPVDPQYPAERLAFVLADTRAPVVLVQRSTAERVPAGAYDIVALDDEGAWAGLPDHAPGVETDGNDLAYVIYTSGSTGRPKGVMVTHHNVVRLFEATAAWFAFGMADVWTLFHSYAFDFSVWEIWGALLYGGRLVVVPFAVSRSPAEFFQLLVAEGVTVLNQTPSAFFPLAAEVLARDAGPLALRYVIFGGEALDPGLLRPWYAQFGAGGPRLVNMYGITETTVHVTYRPLAPGDVERRSVIGVPIPDLELHLLDEALQPVADGEQGEIFVSGPGVARGYLNREELTAQRFLANPFGPGRLYRSGDLARRLPDGDVEYLGRADTQVKVRGFRIELGEIESCLAGHPAVARAVVVVRPGTDGASQLVAYAVRGRAGASASGAEVRVFAAAALPVHMVPAAVVWLDALPLTDNGKVDVRALPAPPADRGRAVAGTYVAPRGDVERTLAAVWEEVLGIDTVGATDGFFDLGGTSRLALHVVARLREAHGLALPVVRLFERPTIRALAAELAGGRPEGAVPAAAAGAGRTARGDDGAAVAIVGMAARFPGAPNVDAFWRNLRDGVESIARFTPEALGAAGVEAATVADPQYVRARGVLADVDLFDAEFFRLAPREAQLMDPQQRLFMELAWEALEHAGCDPDQHPGAVGVFGGVYTNTYASAVLARRPDLVEQFGAFNAALLNEKDYVATRTAHALGLTGPAISVHTACSTSLVALCQAVQSLRAGQCDVALAGAVSLTLPTTSGYLHLDGGMLSADGRTRPFDAHASGTVFSDGAGVVALKRLDDAVRDGDTIHAVVRGAGVNNDGAEKASFTAPSARGQAAVIRMAHADAGVAPRDVSYVEAHGTATPLGDPIEFAALAEVFGGGARATGACGIGSVKSNVGHTVTAAGVAGVIKTALALTHGEIPASLHYTAPNPALGIEHSPFRVVDRRMPWPRGAAPRLAGVSSFGVGGTNAHVVLAEGPAPTPEGTSRDAQLLVVSARSEAALERATDGLSAHLRAHPGACMADVAHTLRVGRRAFAHRRVVVASSTDAAAAVLTERDERRVHTRRAPGAEPNVVFAFPGQGSQYPRMGASFYASEPVYREAFDRCAEAARPVLGRDLREVLFADDADAAVVLRQTEVTQPALYATGYALAALWQSWGVRPWAMVGHSVGEFVAAALAGVFSPEDGMRLVAERGRMMQQLPEGRMLSVRLGGAAVAARLGPELAIAAENGPARCVVAGPNEAVARLQAMLEAEGVACRPLHTSHAFHSPMTEPVVEPFLELVRGVPLAPPRTPIVSSVTGVWLTAAEACDPRYWARHLRETVRFADAVRTVWAEPGALLLEVGPRATLSTLARQQVTDRATQTCIASLGDAGEPAGEREAVLGALGRLWTCGVRPDWPAFVRGESRRRVPLPTYPFERQRYWADPLPAPAAIPTLPSSDALARVPIPSSVSNTARRPRLVADVHELVETVSGVEIGVADAGTSFVELGLDSLVLTQVALALAKRFGVKVTFRQLIEEHTTADRLAAHLDAVMAPAVAVVATPATVAPAAAYPPAVLGVAASAIPNVVATARAIGVPADAVVSGNAVQQLIEQQLRVMTQQLALLAGTARTVEEDAPAATTAADAPPPAVPEPVAAGPVADATPLVTTGPAREFYDARKAFGAAPRITQKGSAELDARQRSRLDAFTRRYAARTAGSKRFADEQRGRMADPRAVTGFRPATKELVYPIVVDRSAGSRMWDVDGNEYVDVASGFGSNLFGWSAPFVVDAVKRQLDRGFEVGPQHPLAGEVAELFAEVTGAERVAFCNTGSEAVLGAIRIARTVTGRDLVAVFSGSYHGINDEVIVRGTRKHGAVPAAPGILPAATGNVLVLDYGTPESLAVLRARAHELAAIVVEPVQSRRPDFQPAEFLRALRTLTEDAGIVYIWDEIITGFRAAPGGAQEYFGVRGDLATYGKVVGGGLPIGVIAGRREFMDALDGGAWRFGDASVPEVGVTYFAGTFVRHPLALAAARAVLLELKARGPDLPRLLTERTRDLADELNAMFRASGAPLEVRHFASIWKAFYTAEQPHGDLLFYMLRDRGVHVYDGFPCFMTASHGEADIRLIVDAFTGAVAEMQEGGFLPPRPAVAASATPGAPPVPGARLGRARDGSPAWFVAHPNEPGRYVQVGGP